MIVFSFRWPKAKYASKGLRELSSDASVPTIDVDRTNIYRPKVEGD